MVYLRLDNALRATTDLSLRMRLVDGKLAETFYARATYWDDRGYQDNSFNYRMHLGKVTAQEATENGIKASVELQILGDPWIPGGPARYEIDLQLDQENQLASGSYSGNFQQQGNQEHEASGGITGSVGASPARYLADHVPFEDGEHPRLLLRKDDIPRLRQLIKDTPEGQIIHKRMEERANMLQGLQRASAWQFLNQSAMYLATGDRKWADMACEGVAKELVAPIQGSKMIWRAPRYAMVALTYDNCYDAWDPEFRLRWCNGCKIASAPWTEGVGAATTTPYTQLAGHHQGLTGHRWHGHQRRPRRIP